MESQCGRFSATVITGRGAHPAYCTRGAGALLGVKRRGQGVDNPSPSSVEVKEKVKLHLCSRTLSCEVCVTECDREAPIMKSWPTRGWCAMEENVSTPRLRLCGMLQCEFCLYFNFSFLLRLCLSSHTCYRMILRGRRLTPFVRHWNNYVSTSHEENTTSGSYGVVCHARQTYLDGREQFTQNISKVCIWTVK